VWAEAETSNDEAEVAFTTFKYRGEKRKQEVVDYILYSTKQLELESTLALPSERAVGADGLPSATFPSDHVPVVCTFRLRPDGAA